MGGFRFFQWERPSRVGEEALRFGLLCIVRYVTVKDGREDSRGRSLWIGLFGGRAWEAEKAQESIVRPCLSLNGLGSEKGYGSWDGMKPLKRGYEV
jgi:hypothetical protein